VLEKKEEGKEKKTKRHKEQQVNLKTVLKHKQEEDEKNEN
jgi:hypothetical protein